MPSHRTCRSWSRVKSGISTRYCRTTSVRRNFYSPISEHERGDTVLINYWNKALIRLASGEERTVGWLESVVVVKDRGEWRILQMHSTRLTPEQIPTNVEFREQR
jgi:hypothetical protein